ncbi:Flavin-dependent halogenase armH4 [Lachnellula suecica]|uniref:Flavin-dependent halogenase armH4 n=1 Tax=Lachnellula suecica TaxID=602035 RepID=A0A8T9CDN7_9HELO|nr:Flavin-dependent halogenase armH4 [Lachnellula suecica]
MSQEMIYTGMTSVRRTKTYPHSAYIMIESYPVIKHTFWERAASGHLDDAAILNSNNEAGSEVPPDADVVVAGGGIHGLIYSIHAASYKPGNLKISLIEKNNKPAYKVGESTLGYFSLWCKMLGLTGAYMLRLFGLKDGLGFYFLDRENQGNYTDFNCNGTTAEILSGFQLERPISELLFTLVAQRRGVNVYHGKEVDFTSTQVQGGVNTSRIHIKEDKSSSKPATTVVSSLLIDATGRFRQMTSKNAPLQRFEGWNCDAFWGYFTCPKNESKILFNFYEGANTNHLCFPEGWAWIIRLPSWEGSPIAGLMDMIIYLLDCAEAGVPGDQIPSSEELARIFGLKFRWVTSIGFAVRNDVRYPEDMSAYGSREAERKFNYFVQKYNLINEFMSNFQLIPDLYGPGTSWFIRKSLAYQSAVVSGPGWIAIGDACGFTNPFLSPGITATMSTSTLAAELTHQALNKAKVVGNAAAAELTIRKCLVPYDNFVRRLIPALDVMNRFNYDCFRDPRLGPQVSCMWQFASGLAVPDWQLIKQNFNLSFETYTPHSTHWAWGAMVEEYELVAREAIKLLTHIPLEARVPDAIVDELIEFSNGVKKCAVDSGRFRFRWDGLLRHYDNMLNYSEEKTNKDKLISQCKNPECASWLALESTWRKCYSCGMERSEEDATIIWNPPLSTEEAVFMDALVRASNAKPLHGAAENTSDAVLQYYN